MHIFYTIWSVVQLVFGQKVDNNTL